MPLKITLTPTPAFFMYVGTSMRLWSGTLEDGTPVTALIASLSTDRAIPGEVAGRYGLTPMPPAPAANWSARMNFEMTQLWSLGNRLTEQEAAQLTVLANGWIADRARQARRAAAANAAAGAN